MRITRITQANAEAFENLCPESISDDADLLLGAVADDDTGCACMAADISGRVLNISWLYTHPDYRSNGAATALMESLMSLTDATLTDCIQIRYYDPDEAMEGFLMKYEFLTEEDEGLYRVPVADIIYGSMMEEMMESIKGQKAGISPVTPEIKEELRTYLENRGYDPELTEGISPNISLIRRDKNRNITGCMLIAETDEENLDVVVFYNEGGAFGLVELTTGMNDVLTHYEYTDSKLIFSDRGGFATEYIEKLTKEDPESYRIEGIYRGIKLLGGNE